MKIKLDNLNDFVVDFLYKIQKNIKSDKAIVIGLSGNLGSGKTTFVQYVAKNLKIKEQITSPTFVIMKFFSFKKENFYFENLIHIDAYRLQTGKELKILGFDDLLKNSKSLIFIEWPENVADILPNDMIKISFEVIDENTREIKF